VQSLRRGDGREEMSDYIKHIHNADGKSWCGKDVRGDWYFLDHKHAIDSVEYGSIIIPCKKCMKAIRAVGVGVDK